MDMSHTNSNYAWNDSNIRHVKYESCSPPNATTTTDTVLQPISLATSTHHPQHPHRHPYHHHHHHHHLAATSPTTCSSAAGDQCSAAGGGSAPGRVDSPVLVSQQQQQLNFATNSTELEMDCGESTVAAYVTGGGLMTYRTGGLGGIGRSSSVGTGNIGMGNSNRISRQDPLSHRIIEKRRRDRMNNCLADLSRLIPPEYLKKGRGRVEKTEIIEMAIMHMKYLQHMNHYSLGYEDCMSETLRFLVEVEGQFPRSPLCVRLLAHLQQHRNALCVRRGSGGSTSSTSHSPVGGGCSGSMRGDGASSTLVLGGGDGTGGCLVGGAGCEGPSGGNGMSITPTPTPTLILTGTPQQPPLSTSPASTPPITHPTPVYSQHAICPTQTHPPCTLKPPKLEPNNNDEDYQHQRYQHDSFSPTCDDGDGCSTLDEADEQQDSKCSLRQRVQQIQLERHSEGYKYKNDIKLRFSQDVVGSCSRRDSNESTGNHSSVSPPLSQHHLSDMCQQQSVKHTMPSLRSPGNNDGIDVKETSFAVPIFALHNKGTFYVPLTVDYRALLPYLNEVDLTTWPRDSVLHPVAINVNFQTVKGHG